MTPDISDCDQTLLQALQVLEAGLQTAMSDMDPHGRSAGTAALQAVVEFVNSIPRLESQTLALPIVKVLAVLHDLDCGRQSPILRPTEVDNRPPESSFRQVIKAYAIFAIDHLTKAGMSLDDACKFVAHKLTTANVPIGNRRDTPAWKTVKGWRAGVSKLDPKNQTRLTLHALREEIPVEKLDSIEVAKRCLGALLNDCLPKLAPALE